jgi:hypothetical protein
MGMGSLVLLVSNTLLISPKNPPKSTKKVRDFPFFCDYIYDKGNMTKVIGC